MGRGEDRQVLWPQKSANSSFTASPFSEKWKSGTEIMRRFSFWHWMEMEMREGSQSECLLLMLPLATVGVACPQLPVAIWCCYCCRWASEIFFFFFFGRKHRQICTKWRHGTRIIIINIIIVFLAIQQIMLMVLLFHFFFCFCNCSRFVI